MKTMVQKFIGIAALGLALGANTLTAWAGATAFNEVFIRVDGLSVRGTPTGARYSADTKQYLSCEVFSYTIPGYVPGVYCGATDSSGKSFACSSTDPRFVEAVKGMTDSSLIYVVRDRNYSFCTDIEITNSSDHLR